MKSKKLKDLVKRAKEELSWPYREIEQESGPLRIFSDPASETHTFFLPATMPEGGPDHQLLYLHELAHAILCERVHPFFAGAYPVTGLDNALLPAVGPVLNAASDWFVEHWMTEFCPEAAIDELKKEYEATAEMIGKGETPSLDKFFVSVLVIARAVKYLKAPVECSGFLDAAVQAFLAVPPEDPSVGKIVDLINSLLALGTPFQCRRVSGEGPDVLEFYRSVNPPDRPSAT